VRAEPLRLPEDKDYWLDLLRSKPLLEHCRTEPFKLIFPAESDVSCDQTELHRIKGAPHGLDPLGDRVRDEERELYSGSHGGGVVEALGWVSLATLMIPASDERKPQLL